MLLKIAQKLPSNWASLAKKYVAKTLQKSPNLVALVLVGLSATDSGPAIEIDLCSWEQRATTRLYDFEASSLFFQSKRTEDIYKITNEHSCILLCRILWPSFHTSTLSNGNTFIQWLWIQDGEDTRLTFLLLLVRPKPCMPTDGELWLQIFSLSLSFSRILSFSLSLSLSFSHFVSHFELQQAFSTKASRRRRRHWKEFVSWILMRKLGFFQMYFPTLPSNVNHLNKRLGMELLSGVHNGAFYAVG